MVREILVIISRRLLLIVSMYGSFVLIVGGFVCDQQSTLVCAEHITYLVTLLPCYSHHTLVSALHYFPLDQDSGQVCRTG